MARGIPGVRTWRVTYLVGTKVVATCTVDTITRRFAKWIAIDKIGYPILKGATMVKCSLARAGDNGISKAHGVRISRATIGVYNQGRIKNRL